MKRFIALLVALMMLFSVTAGAAPAFLSELYTNYTSNASITFELENVDGLMNVLEEAGVLEEIEKNVDIRSLLSDFTYGGSTTAKVDISNDFKTVKMHTASDVNLAVSLNPNMSANANLKAQSWIMLDISDAENPVFKVIQKSPIHNKYEYVDIAAQFSQEDKQAMALALSTVLDKDFLTVLVAKGAELLEKYATIDLTDSECVIRIDDAGIKVIVTEVLNLLAVQLGADVETQMEIQELLDEFKEMDFRILGEDGIVCKYSLENGKPKDVYEAIDISLDLTELAGTESPFTLDIQIEGNGTISDIGTTVVEFPELTEENSFDGTILYEAYEDYEIYEEEKEYPIWNLDNYTEYLPVVNGEVYAPFRQIMKEAFEENVQIGYDNGVITATCDYFPSYKEVKFTVGENTVYTDGIAHTISGPAVIENGVTYVSKSFIEEILGWDYFYAEYNLIEKVYRYDIYTNNY